jgi:cytochrome c-type biogenesis protein CcmH
MHKKRPALSMAPLIALLGALLIAWTSLAHAQLAADDPLRERLRRLETDLRCLVCQNQTLADSNADLANDLRREVRMLADAGKSDDEIRAHLVARYGDFVLYKPPVKPITWLLWFGPFVLLAGGALAWWRIARARAGSEAAADKAHGGTADTSVEDSAMLQQAREALR